MGKVVEQTLVCGGCKKLITMQVGGNEIPACPDCGPVARHFELTINETIVARSSIGLKARRGGIGKPFYILKSGASFFRKAQIWCKRVMMIDRENNIYREVVTNPETGEIIHLCEEPLKLHQGHGTPKSNAPRK